MCPIRHFKTPVTALDSFFNFVVASDREGACKIFLIDEQDLENEEDSLAVQTLMLGSPIHFLKLTPDRHFNFKKEAMDGGEEDDKELRLNLYAVSEKEVHLIKLL
jgi:hypothetical protein